MSINTERLTKIYGTTRALDDVSISVEQGKILGVVGSSGSGKSTLVRNIALLEKPTSGRVVLDGEDLTALSENELRTVRRRVGKVFQSANLLDNRTARANIEYPLEIAQWDRKKRWYRAQELLELVGLQGRGESYPAQLSGGQRQRVGIARALAASPSVLLADEPTSALDPETTREILALLLTLRAELGVTILLITHDLAIVREVADQVAVLAGGRVLAQGSLAEVAQDPRAKLLPGVGQPPEDQEVVLNVFADARAAATAYLSQFARDLHVDVRILDGGVLRLGGDVVSQFQLALASANGKSLGDPGPYVDWLRARGLNAAPAREAGQAGLVQAGVAQ